MYVCVFLCHFAPSRLLVANRTYAATALFVAPHNSLEIADSDALAHTSKALSQLLDKIHFNIEIDWQVRVLVRGIYCTSDVKTDVRRFLK